MIEFLLYYFLGSILSLICATIFNRLEKVVQNRKNIIAWKELVFFMGLSWLGFIVVLAYIICISITVYLSKPLIHFINFVENKK